MWNYPSLFIKPLGLDSKIKAYLRFQGANNSTTFTDETSRIWTPNGAAKISTTQAYVGSSSGYFATGTSSYIDTPNTADMQIQRLVDFKVEAWFYLTAAPSGGFLMGFAANTSSIQNWALRLTSSTSISFNFQGVGNINMTSAPYIINGWNYVKVEKIGLTTNMTLNGTTGSPLTLGSSGAELPTAISKFSIGRVGEYNGLYLSNTYIGQVIITKG